MFLTHIIIESVPDDGGLLNRNDHSCIKTSGIRAASVKGSMMEWTN